MSGKLFRLSVLFCLAVFTSQLPSHAYEIDKVNRIINVTPMSTPAATTTDLRNAMTYLTSRPDKDLQWTLKFAPGNYYLSGQVTTSDLQNTILSSDPNNPAKLIKMQGWSSASSGEYLLSFRMCQRVQMLGMELYGQTSFANGPEPYWPDQGVYFGSCSVVKVDSNKFFNFGNSALRVVTDARDPVPGVNSFKTMVSNNIFNNIYQTATTSVDQIHGGTALSTWSNNTFVNLRGSVKFASRTTGAHTIEFLSNVINGGDHFGLEINNYTNFTIRNNTLQNIKSVAINAYTGTGDRLASGFDWGDNFTIAGNTIHNVGRAIRFSHEPFTDGHQNVPKNLVIDGNTISMVNETSTSIPAIWIGNGLVDGVHITNNKLSAITNKKYVGVLNGCTGVSILNNMVDGVAINLL